MALWEVAYMISSARRSQLDARPLQTRGVLVGAGVSAADAYASEGVGVGNNEGEVVGEEGNADGTKVGCEGREEGIKDGKFDGIVDPLGRGDLEGIRLGVDVVGKLERDGSAEASFEGEAEGNGGADGSSVGLASWPVCTALETELPLARLLSEPTTPKSHIT